LKEIHIDELLKTITWGTFHFCGYDVLHTQKLINADVLTEQQKMDKLNRLSDYIKNINAAPLLYEFDKH
jgi:putative NADPH-quinone reductase